MSILRLSAWAAGVFMGLAAMSAQGATAEVFAYLKEGDAADFAVLADGKEVCTIRIAKATKEVYEKPACRFEWPASAAKLTVRGRYEGTHWRTDKRYRHEGERSWPLADFGPVAVRLKPSDKPYGERVADFIKAADAFARERLGEGPERIRVDKPASEAEIAAAEKRLGYALPREFVSMLRTVGPITLETEHYVTAAKDVDDADTQMRKLWGTPEDAMSEEYSEKQRANLRSSTLLFTEVGDGLAGLRYRPAPTESCGDKPLYHWISQEGGSAKLVRPDRRCMDFAEAFRWVLDGFLIEGYADELASEKGALLVDTSQDAMPLVLQMDADRFDVSAVVRWQGPNGFWRSP